MLAMVLSSWPLLRSLPEMKETVFKKSTVPFIPRATNVLKLPTHVKTTAITHYYSSQCNFSALKCHLMLWAPKVSGNCFLQIKKARGKVTTNYYVPLSVLRPRGCFFCEHTKSSRLTTKRRPDPVVVAVIVPFTLKKIDDDISAILGPFYSRLMKHIWTFLGAHVNISKKFGAHLPVQKNIIS